MTNITFSVPALIREKLQISNLYENVGSSGKVTSFGIDLSLPELKLRKTLKSKELPALSVKIEDTLAKWEDQYIRHKEKQYQLSREEEILKLNEAVKKHFSALDNILFDTIRFDDRVQWDNLKSYEQFSIKPDDLLNGPPPKFLRFEDTGEPKTFQRIPLPMSPTLDDAKRQTNFLIRILAPGKVHKKLAELTKSWESEKKEAEVENRHREEVFNEALNLFKTEKEYFEENQDNNNRFVENLEERYFKKDPDAIEEHTDIVLQNSEYPNSIPRNWEIEYRANSKILVIDFQLPAPDDLPTVESYRYVKSRDEIVEKLISDSKKNKLYEDTIYKITIRTIHEIFEADVVDAIDMVAINGYIDTTNPATGKQETKFIVSVSVTKEQFEEIDLSNIESKATFKHLKGVSAAKLADLAPIPPVISLDKKDKRFIESQEVGASLPPESNVAAMPWQDFEHLIREVFDRELSESGGEVKTTRASADGGIDAVAFDNDPIRGGKIVIQAKRYTNTVGISAVRDLYGTVLNEGASSGILVTTSDYGKDAYEFAKDKPIKLLNGNNLLSLLERQGHKVKIDLAEAKKLL